MVSICLLLDCSYSMKAMPRECIEHIKSLLYKLKEVESQCIIKIIEFGSFLAYQEFAIDEAKEKLSRDTWRCDMGQTALYDAIVLAYEKCPEGGLMIIITDGDDTFSSRKRREAMILLEFFRKKGKVHLVGVGSKEHLMKIFNDQVDEVYSVDPRNAEDIYNSLNTTISSQEFQDSAIASMRSLH